MKMGEVGLAAWGIEDDGVLEQALDEFLPNWRELTPVEFGAELPGALQRMAQEVETLGKIIRRLDEEGQSTESS